MRTPLWAFLFALVVASPSAAQTPATPAPAPPPPWSGSLGLGLAATTGNSDTFNFNASFTLRYDPHTKNVVKAEGLFLQGTANGVTNVDRTAIVGSDEYKLTARSFVFGQLQYLHDQFKDIDYLVAPSGGVGYNLADTARTKLSADAGVGAVWEKDTGLDLQTSASVSARQKLLFKISPNATLDQALSALWKASAFDDALYAFRIGLTLSVTTKVQAKIELLDTYKTKPPTSDVKKNDLATVLALVYKFGEPPK